MRIRRMVIRAMERMDLVAVVAVALLCACGIEAEAQVLRFEGAAPYAVGRPLPVAVSPDGNHVYSGRCCTTPAIVVHARSAGDGSLTAAGEQPIGVHPDDVAVSPDGLHVYVAGGSSLLVFARDALLGGLTPIESESDGSGGVSGLAGAVAVAVSPDGEHVYVLARTAGGNPDGSLAVFDRDPLTGEVAFVEAHFDDQAGVDGLGNTGTGPGPRPLAVSPDGLHVYAAGFSDDAVAVFARDPLSGALSFVEAIVNDTGSVRGLARPNGLAISPDGATVVVASWGDQVTTSLRRDPATGRLTFLEVEPPSPWVGGPGPLAISPDGSRVVGANWVDAVAAHSLAADGSLAFAQALFGGVAGLDGNVDVAVSPDGLHFYVASYAPDFLALGTTPGVGVIALLCGNGALDSAEECDDGNGFAGDGCGAGCELEPCFECSGAGAGSCLPMAAGEACAPDDNPCTADVCDGAGACIHSTDTDGASCDDLVECTLDDVCGGGVCRGAPPACGDGTLTPGCEQCDDGNGASGDGCTPDCSLESRLASGPVEAGGTLSTDAENDGASPATPIEVSVTTPNAGLVSIAVTPLSPPPVGGFAFFGSRIDIEAPVNLAANPDSPPPSGVTPGSHPLVLRLVADASIVPPELELADVAVFKDGALVPPCAEVRLPGEALPDPCVDARTLLGDGDVELVVLSTSASAWNFGCAAVVCAAPPSPTPTPPEATPTVVACREAAKGTLLVKRPRPDGSRDLFVWRWLRGEATASADLGDPTAGTSYTLWILDASGLRLTIPLTAGAGWKSARGGGYSFSDPAAAQSGVRRVVLRPGDAGKARVTFKGKGVALPDAPLPWNPPVRVELQRDDGAGCWQSTFAADDVARNEGLLFKARLR